MTTDGNRGGAVGRLGLAAGVGGQAGHHLVEQIPGAAAVQGADRVGVAEAEPGEGPGIAVPAVAIHLVGDHQGGPAQPAQQAGHPGVLVGDPDGGVDHQHDDGGVGDGPLGLGAHRAGQVVPRSPATLRCRRC